MEIANQDVGPAVTGSTGVLTAVRRLGVNSSIYVVGNLLTRGLNFLLVPVLTRALTPDEYGILAITTTVSGLLVIVLGLGLGSAIMQMYFRYESAEEHRSLYGTLLAFCLIVPSFATLSLDVLGRSGRLDFFPSVPFQPYLRIVIWTSCFSLFIGLPQTIYMTLQQPLKAASLMFASSLVTVGLSLYLVVYLRQGVMGSLRATFISASLMAVISIFLTGRMASWRFSWSKLKIALFFSLPLVPHMMSHWILSLSDRFILAGYVSAGSLGLYSLGQQFGALIALWSGAINNAFVPIVNAQLSDERTRDKVPVLGTYALLVICSFGLGVALFSEELIRLLTPLRFHGATVVVPWAVLGFVFQGVYLVWSRGTWFSMRTGWTPVLTMLAGALNVGLNLWLVPRWGIMAAAVNTAVAYGVLALLHGYLAHEVYPIPWEYDRWVKILVIGFAWFVIGAGFSGDNLVRNVVLKVVILFLLFPVSLGLARFLTSNERCFLLSLPGRFRAPVR